MNYYSRKSNDTKRQKALSRILVEACDEDEYYKALGSDTNYRIFGVDFKPAIIKRSFVFNSLDRMVSFFEGKEEFVNYSFFPDNGKMKGFQRGGNIFFGRNEEIIFEFNRDYKRFENGLKLYFKYRDGNFITTNVEGHFGQLSYFLGIKGWFDLDNATSSHVCAAIESDKIKKHIDEYYDFKKRSFGKDKSF